MSYKPNIFKTTFHNTRRFIAKYWLKLLPANQIAITGSQGKTNVSYILKKTLQRKNLISTDINLDTIYNVPITALKIKPWTKFAIFELGVDHIGEMDKHLEIVTPKVAIVTGISTVHTDIEHLGSLENLIKEKTKLIEKLPKSGFAILNFDDENVRKMTNNTHANILFFGSNAEKCNVYFDPKNIKVDLGGISGYFFDNKEKINFNTGLIGNHQIYNIMAAYIVSKIFNIPREKFLKRLSEIKPLTGRMSVDKGPKNTIILNDGLRANPTSTKFGLKTLSEIKYKTGQKIAILAEMGELENPEKEHREIGKFINTIKIDSVICIGPNQKFVYEEIDNKKNKYFANDVFEAAEILKKIINKNDLIYLKGSLLRHVERVILLFENKQINCRKIICENYKSCLRCKYL